MLTRFACLACDHTWLEDFIIGASDAIEETFFVRHRSSHLKLRSPWADYILEPGRRRYLLDILAVQHEPLASPVTM